MCDNVFNLLISAKLIFVYFSLPHHTHTYCIHPQIACSVKMSLIKSCWHGKADLLGALKTLLLVPPGAKAFPEERHFQSEVTSFFFYLQAITTSFDAPDKKHLQFLITRSCAWSSRISNPRKSVGVHWISPVESIYCLTAPAVPLQLSIFLFSTLEKKIHIVICRKSPEKPSHPYK